MGLRSRLGLKGAGGFFVSLEYIQTSMEVKQVNSLQRIITGYAAVVGNVDLGNDVIDPGAFSKTLRKKQPSDIDVFIGHDMSRLPVGIPVVLRVDGKGLYSETLVKPGPVGDDLLLTAKFMADHGRPLGQSIGYRVAPGGAKMGRMNGKVVRHLLEIDLHEYSFASGKAVMNPEALTTGVKTGGGMYRVTKQGDRWAVMKNEGDKTVILAEFDSEEEAQGRCDMLNADGGDKTVNPNTMPDSAFLYVAPGGVLDDEGKTVPRTLRHFRYRDASDALDAEALSQAIRAIPEAKTLGLDEKSLSGLHTRARALLESAAGVERKTVDATAPEWRQGSPLALRGLGYRLIDISEKLATDHAAMLVLGDDTKTGERMRPTVRAEIRELTQQLGDLVDRAEYVDRVEDGAADIAQRRRALQLMEVGLW